MDIFESEHSDITWNKWNFRLFETKCHAWAITTCTLDLDIYVSQNIQILHEVSGLLDYMGKSHRLAINYFRF